MSTKRKGKKGQKAIWVCVACDMDIEKSDDDSIECNRCLNWCHKRCSNLTNAEYDVLCRGNKQMSWSCKKCMKKKSKKNETESSRLEMKMDKVLDLFSELSMRLINLEEEKKASATKIEEKIVSEVDKKVKEAFEEENEKKRRRPNIVVVNIPESKAEDVEQRQKDDIEATAAVLDKVMGEKVNRGELKDPIRMGFREIGKKSKPRLLKITVANDDFRKKIFKNARKLNDGVKDKKKMVFINPDRTQKERDDYKKLKADLEEGQKKDPDLRIIRGKIVKLTQKKGDADKGKESDKRNKPSSKNFEKKAEKEVDEKGDSSGSDSESDSEEE